MNVTISGNMFSKKTISVLDAIAVLNEIQGKSDIETHKNIKRVIDIMEGSQKSWPSTNLCKIVFKLSKNDKQLFLDILKDMDAGLEEYFNREVFCENCSCLNPCVKEEDAQ